MTRIDKASWQALSPLLDELLDVGTQQRLERLAQLTAQDPEMGIELAMWLAQLAVIEAEGFLEGTAFDSLRRRGVRAGGK